MHRLRVAGAAAGVLLVSAVVLQVSSAAFTGSTASEGNAWGAGTVSLSNDRDGGAMFTAAGMVPGQGDTQCIEVTYDGSVDPAAAITLRVANLLNVPVGDGDGLADDLLVSVRTGAAGTDCGDDLSAAPQVFAGTLLSFDADSPVDTGWTPVASTSTDLVRPFSFTVTLDADAGDDAQGDTAGADFVWSATS